METTDKLTFGHKMLLGVHKVCEKVNSVLMSPGGESEITESEENMFWSVYCRTMAGQSFDMVCVEFAGIPLWDSENHSMYEIDDELFEPEIDDEYKSLEDHIKGEIKKVVKDLNSFILFQKGKQ